jgi:hypothetical protein
VTHGSAYPGASHGRGAPRLAVGHTPGQKCDSCGEGGPAPRIPREPQDRTGLG